MHAQGHMVKVDWDGHTLTAQGTNKAAQVALRGADYGDGPLVLERQHIAGVEVKAPSALANGRLTVQAVDGRRYVLHFRRKQADAFTELAAALGV